MIRKKMEKTIIAHSNQLVSILLLIDEAMKMVIMLAALLL
jgi:hypothetical protein